MDSPDKQFCQPQWTLCDRTGLKCRNKTNNILRCEQDNSLTVMQFYCVTYNNTEGVIEAGKCIYNSAVTSLSHMPYYPYTVITDNNISDLNSAMCSKFNRTGTLCGKCADGYHPLAYSFDMTCVKCPKGKANWWKFLLMAFLPLTVFYFVVLSFKLNITSSYLHGYVFSSQLMALPASARIVFLNVRHRPKILTILRYIAALYTPWNLDFFRSFSSEVCLDIDTLQTLSLDFAVGLYPFVLMVLTYFLIDLYDKNFKPVVLIWRPFRSVFRRFRNKWEIKTSLIDAFVTFLLLTNVKFQSASYDLLAPVKVYLVNSTGHLSYSWRHYYDPSVPYFGAKHLPYAILAVVTLLLFILLPTVLLMVYPFRWFHKFLNLFPLRWYILHTFMDAFQGCYKDGTQPGTRDCRWFASVFFLTRLGLIAIVTVTLDSMYVVYASMMMVIVVIITHSVQPFKVESGAVFQSSTVSALHLALWYTAIMGHESAVTSRPSIHTVLYYVEVLSTLAPFLYMLSMIVHWIYKHGTFRCHTYHRRHGYSQLP